MTVLRERRSGLSPQLALAKEMAHCKRLAKLAGGLRDSTVEIESSWRAITAACRKEVKRAGRDHNREANLEKSKLMDMAQDVTRPQIDAAKRMQRVWRCLREARTASALDAVWVDDKAVDAKKQPEVARQRKVFLAENPERFLKELGNIGKSFVREMHSTPACLEAFRAWCDVFAHEWETIKSTDGSDFQLAKELTWELFLEVLHSMPSGKAVGAGGFHAELLWQASDEIKRVFYDALMADLRNQVVPVEWRTVLYALLVKPPPNDPTVVAERREIALMAHEMKLLLQMVRRVAYQRVVGRIVAEQA